MRVIALGRGQAGPREAQGRDRPPDRDPAVREHHKVPRHSLRAWTTEDVLHDAFAKVADLLAVITPSYTIGCYLRASVWQHDHTNLRRVLFHVSLQQQFGMQREVVQELCNLLEELVSIHTKVAAQVGEEEKEDVVFH